MPIRFSQYPGTCNNCQLRFNAGARINFDKSRGGVIGCPSCLDGHASHKSESAAGEGSGDWTLRVQIERLRHTQPNWSTMTVVYKSHTQGPEDHFPLERAFTLCGAFDGSNYAEGDLLDVHGTLAQHPQYGWQLKTATPPLRAVDATDRGVLSYLQGFPQIGPARAEEILRVFGGREAVLKILEEDPLRLTEVSGISEERALEIGTTYVEQQDVRESLLFLGSLGVTATQQAKILEEWGGETKDVILDDPYALMQIGGWGFVKADAIAQVLGVGARDPRRLAASVLALFDEVSSDGHTWASLEHLCQL